MHLAKKTRDQLFVEDDDRYASLRPLFVSLYGALPGLAGKWRTNASPAHTTALFEGVPLLRADLPGRLTR